MKIARATQLAAGATLLVLGTAVPVGAAQASSSTTKITLTVAYPSVETFDTAALATKWWDQVRSDFNKSYPNVTVNYILLPGGETDVVTKLSLLYRSHSTAPDVAEFPSSYVGLYAASDYLLPLNNYVASSSWFKGFPQSIQEQGEDSGKIYGVSAGENDNALLYDKTIFKKAGIALPWHPTNWADILSAAEKIHNAVPTVSALWLGAGTGADGQGAMESAANLIVGSTTPTIQTAGGKMVVDSPGLEEAFRFYRSVYSGGLGGPLSAILSTHADNTPSTLFAEGKLAIAIGANFLGSNWVKSVSDPYWPQAGEAIGVTPIPRYSGSGYASAIGGWDLGVSSTAKGGVAVAASNFIKVAENSTNLIDAGNWAGWVPPAASDWTVPLYDNFAPPFNEIFAKILSYSTELPTSEAYSVWVQGLEEATGAIAAHPSTSVAQAVHTLKSYVTSELGGSAVTTLR